MQKLTKLLLLDRAKYIALLTTIAIAFLSLVDISESQISIPTSDKVKHAIAYFTLTFYWLFAVAKTKQDNKRVMVTIAACFIYGIVLEVLQGELTSYRTASVLDAVANSVGIALGVLAFFQMNRKKFVI